VSFTPEFFIDRDLAFISSPSHKPGRHPASSWLKIESIFSLHLIQGSEGSSPFVLKLDDVKAIRRFDHFADVSLFFSEKVASSN
jgi:hypothetical protein